MAEDILKYFVDSLQFNPESPLLFTQHHFWIFFLLVLAIFSLIHNRILLRNTFLFFVSVYFYYRTSGWFTLILVFSTLFNFFAGKWIYRAKSGGGKITCLVLGLVVNVLTLCFFKYSYFFADIVKNLFSVEIEIFNPFAWVGNQVAGRPAFSVDQILLPVGISFYTFQCISYIMDVYRRRIEPVKNIFNFGFYVTFFPQLVAGPIVRANEFIPQITKKFFLSRRQFGIAVFWIINGLAKKIILSDYLAVNFIDRVFDNPLLFTGFENMMALIGYSLQIYADFSGYTDIAIGIAMLMGFYLPKNFNSPYKASNLVLFWRRWHISLSKWLQDYLYIPLGGNREATIGTYACIVATALIAAVLSGSIYVGAALLLIALILLIISIVSTSRRKNIASNLNRMDTMLIGGLWHGASWNFVIWGALNGAGMIIYRYWSGWNIYIKTAVILFVNAACVGASYYMPSPFLNVAIVWSGVILCGTFIRMFYHLCRGKWEFKALGDCWGALQTFFFMTMLFILFRAGANLDPAMANEQAWKIAQQMVGQIGGTWDLTIIPQICEAYWKVFALIVAGLLIHWIPENFKRRYRLTFAKLPLPVMALCVILVVFVLYQFVTADLQQFIYFQF